MGQPRPHVNSRLLTETQRQALDAGWDLDKAVDLLLSYVRDRGIRDDHFDGLVGLTERTKERFAEAYDTAFKEHHEEADEAPAPLDRHATDPERKPGEIDKVRLASAIRNIGVDPAELIPAERRARKRKVQR